MMLGWILAVTVALGAPYSADDAQAILQIEAQRMPLAALQDYIVHDDPQARARAARALGRLRTAEALSPLRRLIVDPEPMVRAEAAFALGQTPGGGQVAQDRFLDEADRHVQALLCEAMGKQGGSGAVPLLLTALDARPPLLDRPMVSTAAARALGILARKDVEGVGAPAVLMALIRQLDRLDATLRRNAAYALAQIRPPAPSPDTAEALLHALRTTGDPEVRKLLLYATTDVLDTEDARNSTYTPLLTDTNEDVRVALARVSGKVGWEGVAALLTDPALSVRLEAIQAVAAVEGLDHGQLLLPILQQNATLEAAEAMRTADNPALLEAAAVLAAMGNSPVEGVPALLGNADAYLQARRPSPIRVAAAGFSDDADRLAALALEDGEAPVRTAAAFRLASLEDPTWPRMVSLLDAFDPVVVAIGAGWLAEHPNRSNEPVLLKVLEDHDEIDTLIAAAEALVPLYAGNYPMVYRADPRARALTTTLLNHSDAQVRAAARPLAEALRVPIPTTHHHLVTAPLDDVLTIRQARIYTARGTLLVTLYPEEAPITVWNFVQLAESGFYNGRSIHRVIPDFVVQDGDPRGDGTGGPGWTIPDEISPLRHTEGALGMAHAGPDTGGSQWFITLSPQPHLDGVHTVFGQVHRGQQVLRDLRPGDRIKRIEIERAPEQP